MATKAQRHKAKLFVKIKLCVLVSWWRKCFCTKCKEFTIKTLNVIEARLDGLVKSQKNAFLRECLVFRILTNWYNVIYVILNTKHETPSTWWIQLFTNSSNFYLIYNKLIVYMKALGGKPASVESFMQFAKHGLVL